MNMLQPNVAIVDGYETISIKKTANSQVNLCPLKSGRTKFPKYFSILIGMQICRDNKMTSQPVLKIKFSDFQK